jgi:hypothetical protein
MNPPDDVREYMRTPVPDAGSLFARGPDACRVAGTASAVCCGRGGAALRGLKPARYEGVAKAG